MSGTRVNVDRALYVLALSDAIDWTESFLASHDGSGPGSRHCEPGARCGVYQKDAAKLARYRKAYARYATPGPLEKALEGARAVPIQDLPLNDDIRFPVAEPECERPGVKEGKR